MIVSSLHPVVWLDTSQTGTGYASDDAARNLGTAISAADAIFLPGPILIIDRTFTLSDPIPGYILQGFGERTSVLTGGNHDCDGAVLCSFRLTGDWDSTTPNGPLYAENCQLHSFRGQVVASGCRVSGTFKPVDHCVLTNCSFGQDEADIASPVQVDLTNCTSFVMTNCTGRIEFVNRNSATGTYHVYGGGGTIALKSSLVQWASFTLQGEWRLVERANGVSAPITDYSAGRYQDVSRGQLSGVLASSIRATFVVSGAQSISDTAIEVTAGVVGAIGDVLSVPDSGEILLITSLSGTTFNVTRGAFGTIAQPIANGARLDLVLPRIEALNAVNLMIAIVAGLLTTTNNGIFILDDKLNRLSDLARGVADSQAHYRGATTSTVTDVATSIPVGTDPTSTVIVGSRVQNLRTGELMVVTGSTSSTLSVTRAQAGTTAQAMLSGDRIIEYNLAQESLDAVIAELANISSDLLDTYLNTQTLLTLPSQIFSVDSHVRALMAEASVTTTTVVGFHNNAATTITLASVSGIAAGDWMSALGSSQESELILVTAVNVGPSTVTVVRGQLGTVADNLNGNEVVVLRRQEIIRHVLNLFRNDAETVVGGGGERTVTVFEEDGTTPKAVMEISSDGLDRTRIL